jgi:hypothetical protein
MRMDSAQARKDGRETRPSRNAPLKPKNGLNGAPSITVSEKNVVAAIRAAARKLGKNKLSMRQIDREIRAYRREPSL